MLVFLIVVGLLVCGAAAWVGSAIIRIIGYCITKKWRRAAPVFWGAFSGAVIPAIFEILPAVPIGLLIGALIGFAMSPVVSYPGPKDATGDGAAK